MNARHAAALALVGWYLMVPPIAEHAHDLSQPRLIEGGAQLSDWYLKRAYDTADECENAREKLLNQYSPEVFNYAARQIRGEAVRARSDARFRAIEAAQDTTALCIETDDPRLTK